MKMRLIPKSGAAQWFFYAILTVTAVLFTLFFLIGFDRPYSADPNFNEPTLTSLLIAFVILVVVLAVVLSVWAVVTSLKIKGVGEKTVNGVPAVRIAVGVAVLTVVVMALTFLAGSSQPLMINGRQFGGTWQLKAADMFVASSIVMILLAAGSVIYGYVRSYLNRK